jgi:hypothetical protein
MMKNLIIAFFLLISGLSKADTISNWTVYLNRIKLKTFTEVEKNRNLEFKSDQIKIDDYLTVQYGDDTHCNDCEFEMVIIDEFKNQIATKRFNNESEKVNLSLNGVIKNNKDGNQPKLYLVFLKEFYKGKLINGGLRLFTFTVS